MIIVSACLLGIKCKYDGSDNLIPDLINLENKYRMIPVCPEQLGGLPTPRKPLEILNGKVLDNTGKDFTEHFIKGAGEVLRIADFFSCKKAILKDGSPSCGVHHIYNGKHEGVKIEGKGFTASILQKHGIAVYSEKEIKKAGI
jgi:uncharacterized protein YbbK (DUF523 family)